MVHLEAFAAPNLFPSNANLPNLQDLEDMEDLKFWEKGFWEYFRRLEMKRNEILRV